MRSGRCSERSALESCGKSGSDERGWRGVSTDTSERGLERLICTALAGHPCDPPTAGQVADAPNAYGGVGWIGGNAHDYDREFCVDRAQLGAFLRATQPEAAESLSLHGDGPTRRKFVARLQGEISKRGTVDVLRHGVKHGAHHLDLFYEKLFELGRCVAHFAVDEAEVRFCTHLTGKASWFLPFNRGWNDGAGNPPNPSGIKTDYLWREVLARETLTNVLEN